VEVGVVVEEEVVVVVTKVEVAVVIRAEEALTAVGVEEATEAVAVPRMQEVGVEYECLRVVDHISHRWEDSDPHPDHTP
jgi:hypothetical protein